MCLLADRREGQEELIHLHGVVQSSRTDAAQAEMLVSSEPEQKDCKYCSCVALPSISHSESTGTVASY